MTPNRFLKAKSYNFHFHKNDVTWPLSAKGPMYGLIHVLPPSNFAVFDWCYFPPYWMQRAATGANCSNKPGFSTFSQICIYSNVFCGLRGKLMSSNVYKAVSKDSSIGNTKFFYCFQVESDVIRDDPQQRFLAQHSVATLLRHCFQ